MNRVRSYSLTLRRSMLFANGDTAGIRPPVLSLVLCKTERSAGFLNEAVASAHRL
jgi:hypothetical protein